MKLRIANRQFDSEEIRELRVREELKEVFVTTHEDFYRIKYRSEKDIEDVRLYKKMDNLTNRDVQEAVYILFIVCEFFINTKTQCNGCPLFQNNRCMLMTEPINWRD